VLDEASMVSNLEKDQLVRLANLAGLPRLVLLGDKRQLGAVNAGKPFDLVQRAGIDRAVLNLNVRARDPNLKRAQHAAQSGQVREAMAILKDNIIETNGDDSAILAAETWLKLTPDERERTSIYASGRALRSAVNEAVQAGLKASGELGQESRQLSVLVRVNATREELRYVSSYQKDMAIEARSHEKALSLKRGQYHVTEVDHDKKRLAVADASGKTHLVRPSALRAHGKDNLALFETKMLSLHAGDRIRWTANDHQRGLFNADQARVEKIEGETISFVTSSGNQLSLNLNDPMLNRVDLAYALNAHMAQGLTSDKGIAVMDSRERNLSNQKTFLVTITRLRDSLTLIVDNKDRLADRASAQTGEKASSLDTVQRLKQAAEEGRRTAAEQSKNHEATQMAEQGKEKSRRHDFGL
jgi:ATP-dependent exoDNAse (exonuclease V) alpha subunit